MDRQKLVSEYNGLRREVRELDAKLDRMEAHEGDDGTREDVDAQVALVETISAKRRRMRS